VTAVLIRLGFKRAKALNTATWSEGEPVLIAFERFNALANRSVYTDTDKQAMLRHCRSWCGPGREACGFDHAAVWVDLDA
jgi:hypothetical protein